MSTLSDTQARFQAYVLAGEGGIVTEIAGADDAFQRTRLDIYFNAYRLRLAEALATDYEILKAHIGDEFFDTIARDYIDARPSVFRNVRWFGGLSPITCATSRVCGPADTGRPGAIRVDAGTGFRCRGYGRAAIRGACRGAYESWVGCDLRRTRHPHRRTADQCRRGLEPIKNADGGVVPESLPEPLRWAIWRKQFSPYFRSPKPTKRGHWMPCAITSILAKSASGCASGCRRPGRAACGDAVRGGWTKAGSLPLNRLAARIRRRSLH